MVIKTQQNAQAGRLNSGEGEENKVEALCATGLYCAESVLSAVAKDYAVESPLIPGIATGLCSGMARTCGTCGALTGGILAINLVHGRSTPEQSVESNYALVKELVTRFEKEFKSNNCAELLGCDLGTEEGQQTFGNEELIEKCKVYTHRATTITRELLAEKINAPSSDASAQKETLG
ncbi:MAG: C_GCAxxG_C_C family protein [Gammaproteobacteria bacterium]|nr:C_GCAxxG_C_C family protein [Gammaproteobacteria bacterium]